MINHSRRLANLVPQLKDTPHICFFSNSTINLGEELLYDYGDRS